MIVNHETRLRAVGGANSKAEEDNLLWSAVRWLNATGVRIRLPGGGTGFPDGFTCLEWADVFRGADGVLSIEGGMGGHPQVRASLALRLESVDRIALLWLVL